MLSIRRSWMSNKRKIRIRIECHGRFLLFPGDTKPKDVLICDWDCKKQRWSRIKLVERREGSGGPELVAEADATGTVVVVEEKAKKTAKKKAADAGDQADADAK